MDQRSSEVSNSSTKCTFNVAYRSVYCESLEDFLLISGQTSLLNLHSNSVMQIREMIDGKEFYSEEQITKVINKVIENETCLSSKMISTSGYGNSYFTKSFTNKIPDICLLSERSSINSEQGFVPWNIVSLIELKTQRESKSNIYIITEADKQQLFLYCFKTLRFSPNRKFICAALTNFKELHFLKVSANDDKKFEFEATEIGQVMLLNEILKFIS
ncbi:unnamed protein product, partial [Didymodactylos carnosus]